MSIFKPLQQGTLPDYASDMLWLTGKNGQAIHIQPDGQFEAIQSDEIALRWGHPEGATLALWHVEGESPSLLDWDGVVALGGFVDRTHVVAFNGIGIMVVELLGGAYAHSAASFPNLDTLRTGPFHRDEDRRPSSDRLWYSLLLDIETPFADFMHHALINGNAIDCTAVLGEAEAGWHHLTGLPLLLESLTLLAPGL